MEPPAQCTRAKLNAPDDSNGLAPPPYEAAVAAASTSSSASTTGPPSAAILPTGNWPPSAMRAMPPGDTAAATDDRLVRTIADYEAKLAALRYQLDAYQLAQRKAALMMGMVIAISMFLVFHLMSRCRVSGQLG